MKVCDTSAFQGVPFFPVTMGRHLLLVQDIWVSHKGPPKHLTTDVESGMLFPNG